jgi:hypothetical protein
MKVAERKSDRLSVSRNLMSVYQYETVKGINDQDVSVKRLVSTTPSWIEKWASSLKVKFFC